MQLANQEAQRFNHEYIGTEHILLGLIKEGSGVAATVLKSLEVDLLKIRVEVETLLQRGPDMVTTGKSPLTPRGKKVIEYAMQESRNLGHDYVGTEHFLLGLLREEVGVAAQVLMNLDLRLENVRAKILATLQRAENERSEASSAVTMRTPENASQIIPGQHVVVNLKKLKGSEFEDLEGVVRSECDVAGYATIIVRIFGREVPLAVEWTQIRIEE